MVPSLLNIRVSTTCLSRCSFEGLNAAGRWMVRICVRVVKLKSYSIGFQHSLNPIVNRSNFNIPINSQSSSQWWWLSIKRVFESTAGFEPATDIAQRNWSPSPSPLGHVDRMWATNYIYTNIHIKSFNQSKQSVQKIL